MSITARMRQVQIWFMCWVCGFAYGQTYVSLKDVDEGNVTVFSFINLPERPDSMVTFKTALVNLPSKFSICFWIKFFSIHNEMAVLQVQDQVTQFGLFLLNDEFLADQWIHICIIITPLHIQIMTHGNLFIYEMANFTLCPMTQPIVNQTELIVGSTNNDYFFGQASRLQLFEEEVSLETESDMSNCLEGETNQVLVKSEYITGTVDVTKTISTHFCQNTTENLILLNLWRNKVDAEHYCQHLGGRILDENKDSFLKIALYVTRKYSDRAIKLWTNKERNNKCKALLVNSNSNDPFFYSILEDCELHADAIACLIPSSQKITARCETANHKFKFFSTGVRHILLSKEGLVITTVAHESKIRLQMSFLKHSIITVDLQMGENILGRKSWTDSMNKSNLGVLTVCSQNQFTCDNGQCINIRHRCNGQSDCADDSDEGNACKYVIFPLAYLKNSCPSKNPKISAHITFSGITNIELEENNYVAYIVIETYWKDPRLQFTSLNEENIALTDDQYNGLWMPKFVFLEAGFEDNRKVLQRDGILNDYKASSITEGDFVDLDSYEAILHNGSSVMISQLLRYAYKLNCNYQLFAFPFDVQICNITVKLISNVGCQPEWDLTKDRIQIISEQFYVSMYTTSMVRFKLNEHDTTKLHLIIAFQRCFRSYLYTTFCPCVILCILCMITLSHFRLEDFTNRITVTLSLLLVMASLFSQVVSTLPSSPEPKFIDMFFFYCIIRLSYVFLLHSLTDKVINNFYSEECEKLKINNVVEDLHLKIAWERNDQKKQLPRLAVLINRIGGIISLICDAGFVAFMLQILYDQHKLTTLLKDYNITEHPSDMHFTND